MEPQAEAAGALGCVETPRGRLPLAAVSVAASTSLRFNVLCRFTAFCAVDRDSKVTSGEHRVMQPVERPRGWAGNSTRYSGGRQASVGRSTKTQSGVLKGKFNFMSPEQVRGMPLDPRTEVFALGAILWELLSGERLYARDSDFSVLEAVRKAELPDQMPPGIEPAYEPVLRRALAQDPDVRYANGAELADALDALRDGGPPAPRLADLVMSVCPNEVQLWQQRVALALEAKPPADGSCLLVKRIGIGGTAESWLAVRTAPDHTTELVLTRSMIPGLAEDQEFLESYLDEVSYAAPHPGAVGLLGVDLRDDSVTSVHELVRGVDLQQLISRLRTAKTRMPARVAFEIVAAVGRVLAFMNDLPDDSGVMVGSLHRSLAPTEILISFEGAVKVLGLSAPLANRYRAPAMDVRDRAAPAPAPPQASPLVKPVPPKEDPGILGRLRNFWK